MEASTPPGGLLCLEGHGRSFGGVFYFTSYLIIGILRYSWTLFLITKSVSSNSTVPTGREIHALCVKPATRYVMKEITATRTA